VVAKIVGVSPERLWGGCAVLGHHPPNPQAGLDSKDFRRKNNGWLMSRAWLLWGLWVKLQPRHNLAFYF